MGAIDQSTSTAPETRNDLLASIVVFLVALPLSMGVAIASGVPVLAGLVSGVIGGCLVGLIAGCPLQVSGPAAGLTVIVFDIVNRYGLENLAVVVFLAGAFQLVAGALRLGQWFRAVSPAVIRGLLAGIGFLILAGQFHVMLDGKPPGAGAANLAMIPDAIQSVLKADAWPDSRQWKQRLSFLPRVRRLVEEQARVSAASKTAGNHQPGPVDNESVPRSDSTRLAEGDGPRFEQEKIAYSWDELTRESAGSPWESSFRSAAEKAKSAALAVGGPVTKEAPAKLAEAQAAASGALEAVGGRGWAAMLGLSTLIIIWGWAEYAPRKLRLFPGALIAVLLVSTVAVSTGMPVARVQLPENIWSTMSLANFSGLSGPLSDQLVLQAVLVAVVASAETLLCASAVDQMHRGPRTRYDRELSAQGIGNMLCGLVNALPITGVIVRSSTNVQAGGKTRWSTVMHGLWLCVFVLGLSDLLRMIPTSCLAAILVYTGYRLIDVKSISELRRFGASEVLIYAVTVSMIVFEDLLVGVLCGVALSAAKLLHTFSHIRIDRIRDENNPEELTLLLSGSATFLRLPQIAVALEKVPPGSKVHVDLSELDYIDHACLELLSGWCDQHKVTGGEFAIDWDTLHRRFRRERKPSGERHSADDSVSVTE